MADTITIAASAPTAPVIGTDEVSIGGTAQHVQRMKLVDGADGGTDLIGGTAARGLNVDPRSKLVRIAVTPAISNGAIYAAKDAVGALMTFANAVRVGGGSATIRAIQIVDKGQQMAALDLVLFDRAITAPTDNAIFAPTDAEMANCVGVIQATAYADFSTNSIADLAVGLPEAVVLNGTDLFGVLVARGTPTYTSVGDLVVTITLQQD